MPSDIAYHFNSTSLRPGSVILPGNWGRIIRKARQQHHQWAREATLEQIRQGEFPGCPSRLDCAFFFERIEEAVLYAQTDFTRYVTMILYEVRLLEPNAVRHHADWNALPEASNPTDADACRTYWRGAQAALSLPRRETLAVTPMEIVREIEVAPRLDWKW